MSSLREPLSPEIAPAVLARAAQWMARLWSDNASAADAAACAAWRSAHPEHERAWARLQCFEQQFDAIPRQITRSALSELPPRSHGTRRRALQLLAVIAAGGSSAWLAQESGLWQSYGADYSTATGQTRNITLADGTAVVLDTASAIDVRTSASERRIVLRAGAILVTSAHDPAPRHRPLLVQTVHGTATALGTRFEVRLEKASTGVAVFQGAVALRPSAAPANGVQLQAGQRASYGHDGVQAIGSAPDSAAAWVDGSLVAESMRLDELLAELARYRHGLLRCSQDVASLRVTGVYSLRDTDRALHNLAASLPLELHARTRYWVTVTRRSGT